jgi:hypothetical protein
MAKTIVAHTDEDICNHAIAMVGGMPIQSLDDPDSDEAKLCKATLPLTKSMCLTRWEWNGVTKFADLGAARDDADQEQADWEFVFNLPDDCLGVIGQIDEGDSEKKFRHKVMGRQLLTNDYSNTDGDSAYIEYISISDVSKYSPGLLKYVVIEQAIVLAPKIMGVSAETSDYIMRLERKSRLLVLPEAIGNNQAENDVDGTNDEGESTWITGRNKNP